MFSFKDRVVFITGASNGIGRELAEKFSQSLANTFLMDIDSNIVEFSKELSQKYSTKSISYIGNVAKEDDCINAVKEAISNFSKIDILINNAGITRDNLVLKMSNQEFSDVIDVNLKGPFYLSKYVFPHMSKQRYGRIINITSIVGLTGQAGQANYASSKAGLIGLTKSLAREFAKRNITVNAVAPGFIQTKMTEKLDEKIKSKIIEQIPLERFGTTQDVAYAVMFLAAEESSYITGQVISVNGGLYM